ncbi:MAG: LysR family transcriptional regulator [Paracoccaceae bacterium]
MFDSEKVNNTAPQHPLLYEMIRSFVTLAKCLNLSRAVDELGSTRQTVRRHISQLEESMGVPLFSVQDRRYELTDDGVLALPEAKLLLARGKAWLSREITMADGLQHLTAEKGDWVFFQQEQPLSKIWTKDDNNLMRETFRAWAMSGGEIENKLMNHVRPFLIVFRHTAAGWVCTEFGEQSYYVAWFGKDFARSSIGRPLRQMPAGEEFATMLDEAFHRVEATQSSRLDYVFTYMPKTDGGPAHPVKYQRLMMGGRFPDGSSAVLSMITPRIDLEIFGLDDEKLKDEILKTQPKMGDVDLKLEEISIAVNEG